MSPLPIHPVVIHFPLVFAVLLPCIALIALWIIHKGASSARVWSIPVVLCALLAVSAFIAVRTGENEEERVEKVVAESVLHEHEEAGERFLWFAGALLALSAFGFARSGVGRTARAVTTIAAVGVALAAVQVGAAGGDLVYREGAASAYTQQPSHVPQEQDIER